MASPAFRRRRLEMLPYVASDLTYRANVNPLNPFNERTAPRRR
jgi:hypothetical protein